MRDILGTKSYMDTVLPDEAEVIGCNTNRRVRRLSARREEMLTNDEYAVYLKGLRQRDDKAWINNLHLTTRKKLVPLLRTILMMHAMFSGIKIVRLNQRLPKTNGRPIIFVLTHVGKEDQVVFSRVIKEHYTILSGDYESLHNNIEGVICKLNGVLYFDMRSKRERAEIESRVERILQSGDNILCSMEAAWNLSPNVPVLELFPGMIRSAIRTNAVIMPIGIERFSKKLYGINVCSAYFDPMVYAGRYGSEKDALDKARAELRLQMADVKMQLYFDKRILSQITETRAAIGNYKEYNEKFKEDILDDWTFTEESVWEKAYKSKSAPEKVFEYVIEKYARLEPLYAVINNDALPGEIRERARLLFKKLLVELSLDIKNPIYPNKIHNVLQANLEMWETIKYVKSEICIVGDGSN